MLQDVNDPKQYQLIRKSTNVAQMLQSWQARNLKYAKIVVPVHEQGSVGKSIWKLIAASKPAGTAFSEDGTENSSSEFPNANANDAVASNPSVAALKVGD